MDRTQPRSFTFHILLTSLAVTGAVTMLLLFLRHNGFWIDELYTLHSIRFGWKEMLAERLHRGHFPAYFVMVRLWYTLWPGHLFETALRSFSVIFYGLSVLSFFSLSRRILPGPAGVIAVALFACNEIALRQGSEARMYTVVLLIAVWMTRCWYELQQNSNATPWQFLLFALSITGFAVSATIGTLLISMLVVSLLKNRDNRTLTKFLIVSTVAGLLIFLPGAIWHVMTADRIGVSAIKPLVFLAHPVALMPGVQIWDEYYQESPMTYVLFLIGIVITLYSIITLWKSRERLPAELRRMALIIPIPLLFIIACYPLIELFSLSMMGPPRYYLPLLPMASLLGAWTLTRLPRPVLVHSLLTVFLLLSAYTILHTKTEPFREIIAHLAPQYHKDDAILVTTSEIADGVELYLPGATVNEAVNRMEHNETKTAAILDKYSDRNTVWIIWYRGKHSPLVDVARRKWVRRETFKLPDFSGVRLHGFTPSAGTPPAARE